MPIEARVLLVTVAAMAGIGASGCALTSKAEPLEPRYFTPERVAATSGDEQAHAGAALIASPGGAPLALRLGRIDSAEYLREYMAFRDSELEVGFYEERRWTERPDAYVRRAIEHALFEQRGVTRSVSGLAPQLNVELLAFDEIRKPKPGVLVQIKVLLLQGGAARLEETFVVEQPIDDDPAKDRPALVAQELSRALDRVVHQLADKVLLTLQAATDTQLAAP
jgi:cholesterol transport system auxiliary component